MDSVIRFAVDQHVTPSGFRVDAEVEGAKLIENQSDRSWLFVPSDFNRKHNRTVVVARQRERHWTQTHHSGSLTIYQACDYPP
ncbi:uncharacterized [Tachysurus ichikawai]